MPSPFSREAELPLPSSGDGWSQLLDWDTLLASWRAAARHKSGREPAAAYEYRLGERLLALQRHLASGAWRPGACHHFVVHQPKRRLISAAPFEDRVVHHALMRVTGPRFERSFCRFSFANRAGLGTHAAVRHVANLCGRYDWVLRLDVQKHFASIDHEILMQALCRRVPEPALQALMGHIVAAGDGIHDDGTPVRLFAGDDLLALCRPRGLPIGNLTSQCWSNVYLDALDQFVMRTLGARAYARYVDDFVLFHDDPDVLADWNPRIQDFLARRLRLRVHPGPAQVQRAAGGVPWLGFVVYPDHVRVKSRKVVQATRRLRRSHAAWREGLESFERFDARVQGWIGHVAQARSWQLRENVLAQLTLRG